MDYLEFFLFGVYPYLALGTFLLGSLLRYNKDQKGWKSDSSQLLARGWLTWGNNLFHVGVLFLFAGHFVGFLTPLPLLHALGITPPLKQFLAWSMGLAAGTAAWFGLVILIGRRLLVSRVRRTSRPMDIVLLFWIFGVLNLGLFSILISSSAAHRDGELIVKFMHYVQHLLLFRSDTLTYLVGTPWIYRAHMFMAFTFFLIFPFTRLVHIWSGFGSAISYVGRALQLVRRR
jgi:nitrate reductase gamma subunit